MQNKYTVRDQKIYRPTMRRYSDGIVLIVHSCKNPLGSNALEKDGRTFTKKALESWKLYRLM